MLQTLYSDQRLTPYQQQKKIKVVDEECVLGEEETTLAKGTTFGGAGYLIASYFEY
jgi:hypothetical protein